MQNLRLHPRPVESESALGQDPPCSLEKTLMLGKIKGKRRSRATEDEEVGWHHRPNGREFEETLGDNEGQGNLACCSPWGHKESDRTERPNNHPMGNKGREALLKEG